MGRWEVGGGVQQHIWMTEVSRVMGLRMKKNFGLVERGFTLIELLVVLSIVGLIMALVLPVLGRSREVGYQAKCISNLKQWGLATFAYTFDFRDTLPGEGRFNPPAVAGQWTSGQPEKAWNNLSSAAWYNAVPGYMEAKRYGELYNGTDAVGYQGGFGKNWIFYCPSRVIVAKNSGSSLNGCHYAINGTLNGSGSGGTLIDEAISVQDRVYYIRLKKVDSPSRTLLMTEGANAAEVSIHNILRDRHMGKVSGGSGGQGVNMLFFDGSAKFVNSADFLKPGAAQVVTRPFVSTNEVNGTQIVWGPFP